MGQFKTSAAANSAAEFSVGKETDFLAAMKKEVGDFRAQKKNQGDSQTARPCHEEGVAVLRKKELMERSFKGKKELDQYPLGKSRDHGRRCSTVSLRK